MANIFHPAIEMPVSWCSVKGAETRIYVRVAGFISWLEEGSSWFAMCTPP